ncbi:hypothetical protein DW260_14210 [Clostridium sp. AM22-16AC]|nr:hypothetical protein DW260_14210 [Clostridium sp. AM22-16AC]
MPLHVIQRNNLWRFFHPLREKTVTRDEARRFLCRAGKNALYHNTDLKNRLTAPYGEERRRAASEAAKNE